MAQRVSLTEECPIITSYQYEQQPALVGRPMSLHASQEMAADV